MKKQILALALCLVVMISLCVPTAFALAEDLSNQADMSISVLSNSGFASPRLYLIIGLSACVGLMLVFYMGKRNHA